MIDHLTFREEFFGHVQLEMEPEIVVVEVTRVDVEARLEALLAGTIRTVMIQVKGELVLAIKLNLHFFLFAY